MKRFMLVLAAGVLVSACGGGGGGGSRSVIQPMTPTTPTTPTTVGPAEALTERSTEPGGLRIFPRDAIGNLQQSGPQFGSVVQNFFTAGLAAVQDVATTFNGDRFTVNVTRQNGSSFSLDTDRDVLFDVSAYTPTENPVTNRPAVEGYMVGESGGTYTAGGAFIEWNNTTFPTTLRRGIGCTWTPTPTLPRWARSLTALTMVG